MSRFFPKKNKRNFTSDSGVNYVATVINDELGWIFRKNNNETDFGIDGFVDIVTEEGEVTGQSFAVQIKSGTSFFKHKTSNGFQYYGEPKHLNYYRNQQLPLLLIIYSSVNKVCLYSLFDEAAIESTGEGWKINIKNRDVFGYQSKEALLNFLPPLKDNVDALKEHWAFNDMLESSGVIFYAVDRDDIKKCDVRYFLQFIERLCVNDNLCRKIQGKVEVMIDGYDHDARELYEISEVRKWFKKADKHNIAWFYFCNTLNPSFGLSVYFMCMSNAKVIDSRERSNGFQVIENMQESGTHPKIKVTLNPKLYSATLDANWLKLNKMTEDLGLPTEVNKEISRKVMEHLFPEKSQEIGEIFNR